MTWGAIGGAGVSMLGGLFSKKKSTSSNDALAASNAANAAAANQSSWSDINKVNDLNRQNATWTQQQNQAANDKNAIQSSNDFGSVSRTRDPVTGQLVQTSSLSGPWGENAARAGEMYGDMQGNMANGFNDRFSGGLDTAAFGVNNDVMQALRGQLQPGFDQRANADRARAAAMGSGFGSGTANASMEDQIGRNYNDMNQKAVLGGYDAWRQSQENMRQNAASDLGIWNSQQANNRANMGTTMSGVTAMNANANQDPWAAGTTPQMAQPTVAMPTNKTWEAQMEQNKINSGQTAANNAVNNQFWGNVAGTLGNPGVQDAIGTGISKVKNWWDTPATTSTAAPLETYW
jgi:hypothetical protein